MKIFLLTSISLVFLFLGILTLKSTPLSIPQKKMPLDFTAANFKSLWAPDKDGKNMQAPKSNWTNAKLIRSNFIGANLKAAIFKNADLSFVDFSEADIQGADFTGSLLIGAKFCNAKVDATTKSLPTNMLTQGCHL